MRQLLDVVQLYGAPLHLGQALHHAVELGGALFDEGGLGTGVVVAHVGQLVDVGGGPALAQGAYAAVSEGVHGIAFEAHHTLQVASPLPHRQEHLLHRVLGLVGRPQQALGEHLHSGL